MCVVGKVVTGDLERTDLGFVVSVNSQRCFRYSPCPSETCWGWNCKKHPVQQ